MYALCRPGVNASKATFKAGILSNLMSSTTSTMPSQATTPTTTTTWGPGISLAARQQLLSILGSGLTTPPAEVKKLCLDTLIQSQLQDN